ncbi:MAG TPA: hypothetical protein PKA66_07415 [Gemmatimonadales bacterium]|nr:hypothetical protein [Gemmatimonadales bacterium]
MPATQTTPSPLFAIAENYFRQLRGDLTMMQHEIADLGRYLAASRPGALPLGDTPDGARLEFGVKRLQETHEMLVDGLDELSDRLRNPADAATLEQFLNGEGAGGVRA